ncbi:putative isoamyl alcohol oxidase [Stachybotrys elegans]|uniref:Isoamyl alcohol oxidase n=1 Tax=Stachybotrys elegans TaxID=80388 RepID=A0A8K0SVC8_9HYPO|nr:putative isoamyl alcohol oxidase [Stachybotrys elegans]
MKLAILSIALGTASALIIPHPRASHRGNDTLPGRCKPIPGDSNWPSRCEWASLNATVGGRLIATVPQGSVCHNGGLGRFNLEECTSLQAVYDLAVTQESRPAEIINPYFQNQSCNAFYGVPDTPCELGNLASYSINVTSAEDVIAGVQFAREKDIRLVVKNTGHDYSGRSTGKGALSLWTHNLQNYTIYDSYHSADSNYTGPAVKLGAGIIGGHAYEYVAQAGYRIVGGECPSVGIAGGYTTGGGHSLLSSKYGMGADGVLEWEVVTPNGTLVTATPTRNSDLYWALSGGGGSTWGVTLSMTTRLYPEGKIGAGSLTFSASTSNGTDQAYWDATAALYSWLVDFTAAGNTMVWVQSNTTFFSQSITVPDQDAAAVDALFAPLLQRFEALGVAYTWESRTMPTYYDHFGRDFGPLPYGQSASGLAIFTSRLIPRAVVADARGEQSRKLMQALRHSVNHRDGLWVVGCVALDVSGFGSSTQNAVFPRWRDAVAGCVLVSAFDRTIPWEDMLDRKLDTVDNLIPALEEATPGGGVYANEVDPLYRGDIAMNLYGETYPRLLEVQQKYDPDRVFWGSVSVGYEHYEPDAEGRLCRTT